jgi:hypothetical protein
MMNKRKTQLGFKPGGIGLFGLQKDLGVNKMEGRPTTYNDKIQ